jgi:mediator of RNA polymerase II transcription subunit 18
VRRALQDGVIQDLNNVPWMLRYVGNPEMGDQKRPTVIRNCIDVACSHNLVDFLRELRFKLDFEYVAKGHMFRKGRMKITVSKILRVSNLFNQ